MENFGRFYRTGRRRVSDVYRKVNAEPVLFLYGLHEGISRVILSPFIYNRQCAQLYWKDKPDIEKFCMELPHMEDTSFQERVEQRVAILMVAIAFINSVPLLLSCPLLSAWSDAGGGRIRPLLISAVCGCVGYLPILICASDYRTDINWILLTCFIFGVGGQHIIIVACCYSLITDDARKATNDQSRISFRVSLGTACFSLGNFVGVGLVIWFQQIPSLNHYRNFILIGQIMLALCVVYTALWVRETTEDEEDEITDSNQVSRQKITCRQLVSLALDRYRDACKTVMIPREGKRRLCLILTLCLNVILTLCFRGAAPLILLFVKLPKFDWSDQLFVLFQFYTQGLTTIGQALVPAALHIFPFIASPDTLLILVGSLAGGISFLLTGFAANTIMIFVAGSFVLLAGASIPGLAGLYPKLVTKEETARVFSLSGIIETICNFFGSLLFSSIYSATVGFWPGTSFILAAAFHIPVLIGYSFIHVMVVKDSKRTPVLVLEPDGEQKDDADWTDADDIIDPRSDLSQIS